jgi:enterochelin esterase family protein
MKLLLVFPFVCAAALAQGPQAESLVSPEVQSDRRATFRIRAPKAAEVTFFGDWMPVGKQEKMTKGDDGVWSITVGPLPPSIYLYTFTVDGVTIADPVNPRIKLRSRTSASMVEISGEKPELWQARDVPHGAVALHWQKSKVLGDTRWIWVYTPPGYENEPNRKYPVLYLLHGSNDIAGGWTLAGQANFILDNLIAESKATPMVVVMPYGHAVPFGSPRNVQGQNTTKFEEYLLQDVTPYVESKFRVVKDREKRAIAGLSMGGGQSIHVGFSHPEMYSAVGAFSAAVPQDFEKRFAALLGSPKETNKKLKLIWFACGKDDSLFKRSEELSTILRKNDIHHTWRPSEGAHTYTVWRQYLGEFAPLLFR